MEPTYYQILGVSNKASVEDIKKEYRRIAKKYHPDANPGDKRAEEIFKNAGEAYAILADSDKRNAYDKELAEADRKGPGPQKTAGKTRGTEGMSGVDFGNMSASFEQFFGFQPGSTQMDEDKLNANKKKGANPMDMTEMFERYMGMKK